MEIGWYEINFPKKQRKKIIPFIEKCFDIAMELNDIGKNKNILVESKINYHPRITRTSIEYFRTELTANNLDGLCIIKESEHNPNI